MLILSYGMPKTGSTLLFELTKATVESCGNVQELLPLSVATGHAVNFTDPLTEAVLSQYQKAASDRLLVLKTHSAPTPYAKSEYEAGRIQLMIAIRDPRDIALSLVDHGNRSRADGKPAFSQIHNLSDAAKALAGRTNEAMRWIEFARDKVYKYEEFATDLPGAVSRIAKQLNVRVSIEDVLSKMKGRFTQMNKGIINRHQKELGADEQIFLAFAAEKLFKPFYLPQLQGNGVSRR